jgi:DNA-binding CsgD family transcriptional regulator
VAGTRDPEERELLRLQHALAAVSSGHPLDSLAAVAEALVPAVPIELATIRLLDERGHLHLLAACGLAPAQTLKLALTPLEAERLEPVAAEVEGNWLAGWGLRWVRSIWLQRDGERLGVLTVGSRSDRRPTRGDEPVLEWLADQLACGLQSLPRTARVLRSLSLELARRARRVEPEPAAAVERLRPRERAVLALYARGLGTQEIADLLVLSPHTIRTHVRNALKRLGVSSRRAAAELVAAGEPPAF